MYTTVRTYKGDQSLTDALVERQDEVKKLIGSINGFHSYQLIRTGDGATTISTFDSEAGASESTRVAADWIKQNLPDLGIPSPAVSGGEVAISF